MLKYSSRKFRRFILKAAAIDLGTNTVKLTIGERYSSGKIDIVCDTSLNPRLGENVDKTGLLQENAQTRTISALKDMLAFVRKHNVGSIRTAATSAVRDAKNSGEFIRRAKDEVGIDIEILSESDEGRLSYKAIDLDPDLKLHLQQLAVVDIGGGSTEITFGSNGNISYSKSMHIGAVRFTERILKSDPPTKNEIAAAQLAAEETIIAASHGRIAHHMVGIGGSAVNLARMLKKIGPEDTENVHGIKFEAYEISGCLHKLSTMNVEQLKKVVGIEPQRADIILAGVIILDSVMSVLQASDIIVSIRGLRYGLLYEMLEAADSKGIL